jgi:hypothetical protein
MCDTVVVLCVCTRWTSCNAMEWNGMEWNGGVYGSHAAHLGLVALSPHIQARLPVPSISVHGHVTCGAVLCITAASSGSACAPQYNVARSQAHPAVSCCVVLCRHLCGAGHPHDAPGCGHQRAIPHRTRKRWRRAGRARHACSDGYGWMDGWGRAGR